MNDWISTINYASTYKTAALRMRNPLETPGRVSSMVYSELAVLGSLPVGPRPSNVSADSASTGTDAFGSKSSGATVVIKDLPLGVDIPPLDLRVKRGPSVGGGSRILYIEVSD